MDVPNITVKSEDSHVQQQDTLTSAIIKCDVTPVQLTLAFAGNTQHFASLLPLSQVATQGHCHAARFRGALAT
jgi:hypothetical protein